MGRKTDALLVWEQGYEHAQHQSADLKLLLELEELLTTTKQGNSALYETNGSPVSQSESDSPSDGNLTEICENQDRLSVQDELCDNASDKSLILLKSADNFDLRNELNIEDRESNKSDSQVNGSPDVIDKLSYNSESCNNLSDTSESRDKDKVVASLVVTHLMLLKFLESQVVCLIFPMKKLVKQGKISFVLLGFQRLSL